MKLFVGDIEATGLDIYHDKPHCAVFKNPSTGEVVEFRPEDLPSLPEFINSLDAVVFHNGCSYDTPLLEQHFGMVVKPKVYDTLVLSQLLYPDRFGGKHGVEAWGNHFGIQKPAHEDWSVFSEEMLNRCREDVRIQIRIWEALVEEAKGWDWSLASRVEHGVAKYKWKQERVGCEFDIDRARELCSWLEQEMEQQYEQLKELLGYWPVKKGATVSKPFKTDGTYTKQVEDWLNGYLEGDNESDSSLHISLDDCGIAISRDTDCVSLVGGAFTRISWHPIELSQTEKVARRLVQLGWEPTEYTPTGIPKLRPNKEVCPNLLKMEHGAGPVLAEYSKYQHRHGQIKGWIEDYERRGDGRVTAAIVGITSTGRRRHKIVVNVPKAKDHVFLGKEMRGLFKAKEGYKIVGWDAASIQLRIGAHYANDMEFARTLVEGSEEEGTDPHSLVMTDAGLANRDEGKKAVYTGLFGGSEKKFTEEFGSIGPQVRDVIYARFPGVLKMAEKVNKAAKRGWLKGIDDRKIWMRKDETGKIKAHAGLVTLIQSCEGILMAYVYALLGHMIEREGLDAQIVIFSHDEIQAEVHPEHIDRYIELSRWCMKKAEKQFNFRVPLDIGAKVGDSWATTH